MPVSLITARIRRVDFPTTFDKVNKTSELFLFPNVPCVSDRSRREGFSTGFGLASAFHRLDGQRRKGCGHQRQSPCFLCTRRPVYLPSNKDSSVVIAINPSSTPPNSLPHRAIASTNSLSAYLTTTQRKILPLSLHSLN
jgi:hypothetical protein